MDNLENCPFCGGTAKHEAGVSITPMYGENGEYVDLVNCYYSEQTGCPLCDIWFYGGDDDAEGITIERWNKRVRP